ncbi:MAG: efflux RND transporter periplasmic adaptor subunit [Aquificaceae bacterium]|nr:efflux RND transporter periplasmic adaptor subunit [Aquificaceae bacterium]MDW8423856.1 efflux RND transporter periplasmic adaptor subunit [Aquificaceae bacterium]
MRKLILLVLFVLAGGLFLYFAVKANKENTVAVEEKEVKTLVYGSGYARNKDYVILKAEVSGYVKEVFVKEGDYVKKGQVLALLDSGPLEEGIREVSERLKLVKERAKDGSNYIKSFESAVESARINMEKSKNIFERRERLFYQGLIPKESYEQSKAQYEMAIKEYERAKSNYEDAIEAIRAEERILMAEKQRLLREKERYSVKSPIEGYILRKFVNPGDYVNAMGQDNRLFSIGSKEWEVWLDVDEEYAGFLKVGQKVLLRVDAYPDKTFEGELSQIIRDVDRSRKLLTVKVKANLPLDTPSGATVDGQIEVERSKKLLLPAQAYRDGYVIVYDGVRRVKAQVKVGKRYGEYLEVIEGLKPGDRVLLP